jgi:hypothetical protein
MDSLAQPKHQEMDMRFGTWNVRSLYRSGSLKTLTRKLAKYKLDLVGVQKSEGRGEVLKGQKIILSSMEQGLKTIS